MMKVGKEWGFRPMAWAAWPERCPQTTPLWKMRPRGQGQGCDLMCMESEFPAWCFWVNSWQQSARCLEAEEKWLWRRGILSAQGSSLPRQLLPALQVHSKE